MQDTEIMLTAAVVAAMAIALVCNLVWRGTHWFRLGVPGPWPQFYMEPAILRDWPSWETDYARRYGRFYGRYLAFRPILVITDAELIKQILVKQFSDFVARFTYHTKHKRFNTIMLFNNDAGQWRKIRPLSSRSFTASKLRTTMVPLFNTAIDRMIQHLDRSLAGKSALDIQPKHLFNNLILDIVSLTGYSPVPMADYHKCGQDNPLIYHGERITQIGPVQFGAALLLPRFISKLLNVNIPLLEKSYSFYEKFAEHIIRVRRESGMRRQDVLQWMMNTKSDQTEQSPQPETKLTEDELIGNFWFYLVVSFETIGNSLLYLLYELACNPNIQQRLHQELAPVLQRKDQLNSKSLYEILMSGAPYLEAVVNESYRKYPTVTVATRRVMVDGCQLNGVPLAKGQNIWIPIHAVHRDPEYWPEPERFDPERFMPDNRDKLVPYAYLPFAAGPRMCIAQRYSTVMIHYIIGRMVTQYRFEPADDTPKELKFLPRRFTLGCAPFQLRVIPRPS